MDEREYNDVSLLNTSGRRRWKKHPSWFPLEDTSEDYSSSETKSSSSSEKDEEQLGSDDERSENDAHVEIESDGESHAHESSSSCPNESSYEGNTRKK